MFTIAEKIIMLYLAWQVLVPDGVSVQEYAVQFHVVAPFVFPSFGHKYC